MQGIIEIDLHNHNKYQARIALNVLLRRADGSVYRIRVIHGNNHGTELKDLLSEEFARHPRVLRLQSGTNKGQTDLILREM